MRTRFIGQILKDHRGIGPGFDFLRLLLSFSILAWHCVPLSKGQSFYPLMGTLWHPVIIVLLPLFFALSGFLVTGSALRTQSIRIFLAFRALRLIPALTVEVALSAILLGGGVYYIGAQ